MTITSQEYNALEQAYDWFNADLFEGRLPAVLITFQRKANSAGFFSPGRFAARNGGSDDHRADELALNPAGFVGQTDLEILQTLVHEMAHVWQEHFGEPGRGAYHNQEWANKMISLGLMPSSTGQPGGKTTGQSMSDYVVPGAPFEKSALTLLCTGFKVNWQSLEPKKGGKPPVKSKVKYTCPACSINAWGKPELSLICGECMETMAEA